MWAVKGPENGLFPEGRLIGARDVRRIGRGPAGGYGEREERERMLNMLSSSKSTEDEGARRQRPQKAIILESNEINLVRLPSNAHINHPPSFSPMMKTK